MSDLREAKNWKLQRIVAVEAGKHMAGSGRRPPLRPA